MSTVSSSSFDTVKSFSISALDKTDQVLTKSLGFLSNNYLYTVILVLLILYAPAAAPMLSRSMAGLLGNYAVKFIYVFLLSYLLSKSVKVSLVTTVAIVVGIFVLKKFNNDEHFDGSGSDVDETDLSETDLSETDLSETDLSGTDLSGTVQNIVLPQEPVIDREQIIKPVVEDVDKVPVAADLLSNVHADATHVDTLKPLVIEEKKEVVVNETDIINVCGSRLSKDGYSGFDKTPYNYGTL
jgi:hypothetical protein